MSTPWCSGPLQWSRGHVTAERSRYGMMGGSVISLQWSRGHVTAESAAATAAHVHSPSASMEPRSCDRGEQNKQGRYVDMGALLQWSRGHVTAESLRVQLPRRRSNSCFNGAAVM